MVIGYSPFMMNASGMGYQGSLGPSWSWCQVGASESWRSDDTWFLDDNTITGLSEIFHLLVLYYSIKEYIIIYNTTI